MLQLEQREPARLVGPAELDRGALGERAEEPRVALARVAHFGVGGELLQAVLANGLQKGVARLDLGVITVAPHETLVEQRRHEIHRVADVPDERLGGLQAEAVGEDGDAPKCHLFGWGEQVVAPVDCRAQRAMTGRGVARAVG